MKLKEARAYYDSLSNESKISGLMSIFLWGFYFFGGGKDTIELWQLVIVNAILVYATFEAAKKEKAKKKDKEDGKKQS